jgi:hypothetical protein
VTVPSTPLALTFSLYRVEGKVRRKRNLVWHEMREKRTVEKTFGRISTAQQL